MRCCQQGLILFTCGLLTIGPASFGLGAEPDEPRYNGIPLTTLLDNAIHRLVYRAPTLGMRNGGFVPDPVAEAAVTNIGTNALPYLVNMLRQKSPSSEHPAVNAFRLLGPTATPAVPALEQLAYTSQDHEVTFHALQALGYIGTNALPALERLSTNAPTRRGTVSSVIRMAQNGAPVYPLLTKMTEAGDEAAETAVIGMRHLEATNALPVLTNLLQHSQPHMRKLAVDVIRLFYSQARPAIPSLVQCLYDSDTQVRQAAAQTLRQLAPEMFVTNSVTK